jgi:predicted membrane protein
MNKKSLGEIFIGLTVLFVGVGLFADALNVIEFGDIFRQWWPVGVIAAGLISFISNPRAWLWPSVTVIVGVALLLNTLNVVDVNIGKLIWPSILIFIGISVLAKRKSQPKSVDDDRVDSFVAFAGSEERSVSQDFKGGKMSALFGGTMLDLNDAKLTKDGADLDVFTFCGGIELRVPDGWVVKVTGMPLFGGWENKTRQPANPDKAPVLRISGTCVFGGFSVKNGRSND